MHAIRAHPQHAAPFSSISIINIMNIVKPRQNPKPSHYRRERSSDVERS
jgi:hypothetical protein